MNVVEHTLAGPLAENPYILERVLEKLTRHEKVSRESLVFDWTICFEGNWQNLFRFELFGHFVGEFLDLIGQTVKSRDLALLYRPHPD
jgi:hypothetical protein